MSEEKSGGSWWQSLPGILTGIAALVTAVGGVIAVIHGSGSSGKPAPAQSAATQAPAAAGTVPLASREAPQGSGGPSEVRAGHYVFKLLGTRVEPHASDPNGSTPSRLALHVSLRVTDVMGKNDYIDGNTIRLAVDGAQLHPENEINAAVYDRASIETQVLFIVPADAANAALLLGRPEDAVVRLPLDLHLGARDAAQPRR